MKTNDYDRIIDLYLDGALGPVEEREFRRLLEIDPDLRSLLDAELAVRATFAEDAEAIPVETERSYTRFLAALAATGPAAPTPLPSDARTGGWMGAGMAKLAGAAVVVLGLATGGYFAFVDDAPTLDAAAPAHAPIEGMQAPDAGASRGAAAETATPATTPGTAASAGATTNDVQAPSGSTARSLRGATQSAPTRAAESSRLEATAKPETKALVDPHDDLTEIDRRSGSVDELPVIESDSVSAKVNLKTRGR